MIKLLAVLVIAYFLGALPFGYLVARFQGTDIFSEGSGNIGFTNVWRVLGIKSGIVVLICDLLKGYLAAMIGFGIMGENGAIIGGIVAILAHTFSIFIKFKGGKGVACGAGVVLYLSPLAFLFCVVCLSSVTMITRYMSLGSITTAILCPFILFFLGEPMQYVLGIGCCCIYVIYKHKPNIIRLMNGTENKIGKSKSN